MSRQRDTGKSNQTIKTKRRNMQYLITKKNTRFAFAILIKKNLSSIHALHLHAVGPQRPDFLHGTGFIGDYLSKKITPGDHVADDKLTESHRAMFGVRLIVHQCVIRIIGGTEFIAPLFAVEDQWQTGGILADDRADRGHCSNLDS